MSLTVGRTVGRLWLASSVALFGAVGAGCSDGSSTSVGSDAGDDAGEPEVDAGEPEVDAGEPAPTCDALVNDAGDKCECVALTSKDSYAEPCWMDEAKTVCGVKSSQLPGGDPTKGDQCVVRDAAGTPSTYCGDFFDQIDALVRNSDGTIVYDEAGAPTYETDYAKGKDRALTFQVPGTIIKLRFEGCCLPNGECGAMLSEPRALDAREPNVAGKQYVTDFTGENFNLHLGCTSVPELVARLSSSSAGESLPSDKLVNLPYCQYSADGDPGVITSGTVPGVPEFVCGCGEGETTSESGLTCLQNISADVCGDVETSAATLALVPAFVCGCGTSGAPSEGALPCLPNVATDTCGTAEPTAEQLAAIPQFLCGADPANPLPAALTLPNVDKTVCGTLEIAAESPYLGRVPEFLCGATDSATLRPTSAALPKLPNLSAEICGMLQVTSSSPLLASFPTFLCGCTDSNAFELGCLPNIEATMCGTAAVTSGSSFVAQVPKFLCGCGDRLDTGVGGVCMSNTATDVCGSAAVAVNDKGTADNLTDDCLVGVPEYAHGCGADVATPPQNDSSCLRNTAALFGCDNVASTAERLPEFLCGCGDGVLGSTNGAGIGLNRLPCLPNVIDSVCGGVDVTSRVQLSLFAPTVPNAVCGCGNGITSAQPCLDNVDTGICGPQAVCTGIGEHGSCANSGEICFDLRGTTAGSPGDGIGDVCAVPPNG